MIWALIPLLVFAAFCLLWPVITHQPAKVRPLTMDEQAAQGIYRIQDAAKVARMKSTRAQDTRAWDARFAWLERGIKPRSSAA